MDAYRWIAGLLLLTTVVAAAGWCREWLRRVDADEAYDSIADQWMKSIIDDVLEVMNEPCFTEEDRTFLKDWNSTGTLLSGLSEIDAE